MALPRAPCCRHCFGTSPDWALLGGEVERGRGGGRYWRDLGWKVPGRKNHQRISRTAGPCWVRTHRKGFVVQSQCLWKGLKTCRCRREEAGLCLWWPGKSGKVAQGLRHPPASLISHFQLWLLTPGLWGSLSARPSHPPPDVSANMGELPALPGLSPGPDPSRPWSKAAYKDQRGAQLDLGRFEMLGELPKQAGHGEKGQ